MPRTLLIAMAALGLSGCVAIRSVPDGVAYARFGETVQVGPATIAPARLLEDSRCPAKVQCIRAGTVRILAQVAGQTAELEWNQPIGLADGTLALVSVYPARRESGTLYPDEYRFGFRWDKRQ